MVKVIIGPEYGGYCDRYVLVKCTPGATYQFGGDMNQYSCPLIGENADRSWETVLGEFRFCWPTSGPGSWFNVEMWFVEWSPDINAQDTMYSLDEETHVLATDGEMLTEEEADKWNTILEENNQ